MLALKIGGGFQGVEEGWGDVLGGDVVLSCLNPFLKTDQIVMCQTSHG